MMLKFLISPSHTARQNRRFLLFLNKDEIKAVDVVKGVTSVVSKQNALMRSAYDEFPDFFRMGTFIDSTHMKLLSPEK